MRWEECIPATQQKASQGEIAVADAVVVAVAAAVAVEAWLAALYFAVSSVAEIEFVAVPAAAAAALSHTLWHTHFCASVALSRQHLTHQRVN